MSHTGPLVPLPFDPTPPTRQEVADAAARSPMVASVERLREHLGPRGLSLSEQGGLRIMSADAHAIAGIRPVADPDDPEHDLYPDPSPRLRLLLGVALESGAVVESGGRLVVGPQWADEDVIVRADAALNALFDLGPMRTSLVIDDPLVALRDQIFDGSCVGWLATLLPDGRTRSLESVANTAIDVCREALGGDPLPADREFEVFVANGVSLLADLLEWAGAITWEGRELLEPRVPCGVRWFVGGTIRLTALGRHVLPDRLAEAGMCLRAPAAPGSQPAASLLGDLVMAQHAERAELVATWRLELSVAERAQEICRALIEPHRTPLDVMAGFDALARLGPPAAAPFVRQLLDSPIAQHAAVFLVDHGLADAEALQPFLGYNPLIEHLAALVSHPHELARWMTYLLDQSESPELMLELIALHRSDAAGMLLTAAARHVTDERFAPLLRAAERYHHAVINDVDGFDDLEDGDDRDDARAAGVATARPEMN